MHLIIRKVNNTATDNLSIFHTTKINETVAAASDAAKGRVYSRLSEIYPVAPDIRTELKNTRGLTDQQIDQHIIAPPQGDVVARLLDSGLQPSDLIGVPGFYGDFRGGNILFKGQRNVQYVICNRGPDGEINGLIAKFNCLDTRYGWYSSKNLPGGVTSGAPAGVVLGRKKHRKVRIAICEGFFKACAIARTTSSDYVIYVNGIQCSADIYPYIEQLTAGQPATVTIVPDTDVWDNLAVMGGTIRIIERVAEQTQDIQVAIWPLSCGKGYDDVIAHGHIGKIRVEPVQDFLTDCLEKAKDAKKFAIIDRIHDINQIIGKEAAQND